MKQKKVKKKFEAEVKELTVKIENYEQIIQEMQEEYKAYEAEIIRL